MRPARSIAAARPRKFPLVSILALLVFIPIWILLLQVRDPLEPSMHPELTMLKRLMWWLGIPVLLVITIVGSRWQASRQAAHERLAQSTAASHDSAAKPQDPREYVLEIISMGVTLDKYRQGALWDVLSKGHSYESIRDLDPKHYPWADTDKLGLSGGRSGSTLENAIRPMPMYWVAPSFFAGPPWSDPSYSPSETMPFAGLTSSGERESSGLAFNMFVPAGWALTEHPDRLLEHAFEFFDKYSDVPYLVVSSYDDDATRDQYSGWNGPNALKDGYYVPKMPDTSAVFVLARRERVDALRTFVFDDLDENRENIDSDTLNEKGVARRVFLAFNDLEHALPHDQRYDSRSATVPEWLDAAAAFSKRSDIYQRGFSLLYPFDKKGPSPDFKPTSWFPVPWNRVQLDGFDRLPTLGYLHRPVYVPTVDKDGKPLTRGDARTAALAAGWQEALRTLPEAERKAAPARVVVATGGDNAQTAAITNVFQDWAKQGGPELDSAKASQWINTDARLGNTGAATWFMQMAIGVMGSYHDGGTSAAINLRDPSEASIIFITPPSDTQRQKGASVLFKDKTIPAIDPKNYEQK